MKPKTKVLVFLCALIFPYIIFTLHLVFSNPKHLFPDWYFYAAPCYFAGAVALFVLLRKRLLASTPNLSAERMSAVRAMRVMGYAWWLGLVFYFLSGGLGEPLWTTGLAVMWVGFLSWLCFHEAKKIEAKASRNIS